MKNNPECFAHCPRILDAAERAARLGKTGVVRTDSFVKQPVEALISECETIANSNCEGPTRHEVLAKVPLLGRLGLMKIDGSNIEYVCGITGQGRQEKRYLFRDTPPIA
jgi:hypothetical protein